MCMKKIKRLAATGIIVTALLMPLFLDYSASGDTAQPTSVSLSDVNVYNSLITLNDTLFIAKYNIVYGTIPTTTVDTTFIFELKDGATLKGSVTAYPYYNLGYGQGVVSFYFPPGSGIIWGTGYDIVISESPAVFDSPTYFTFPVSATAYSPYSSNQTANRELLQTKVTTLAQQLTVAWSLTSTPLTETASNGVILSSYGEAYFRNAVYGLQAMCPALFLLQNTNLDYTGRAWDYSFASILSNTFLGTWVYTDILAGFAGIWGVPTSTATSMFSFIFAIVIFCISVGLSQGSPQSVQGAFLDAVTVLIFATLSGMFSAVLDALFAFIFVLVGAWILLLNKA